jgi:hypothetical protein
VDLLVEYDIIHMSHVTRARLERLNFHLWQLRNGNSDRELNTNDAFEESKILTKSVWS